MDLEMAWVRLDRKTRVVSLLEGFDRDLAERGVMPLGLESVGADVTVAWIDTFRHEHERRARERALEKRVEGLKEAVRRWRQKAGVDPPPSAPVIIGAEVAMRNKEWVRLEHYVLPVEKNPALIREAWECVQGEMRKNLDRLYFNERHGWVAVVRREWDLPGPKPGDSYW